MTGAEYAKARRDKAREAQLCLVCCKRPKLDDKTTCEHCTKQKSSWYLVQPQNKASRSLAKAIRGPDLFNVCCQAWGFHRDDCHEEPQRRTA